MKAILLFFTLISAQTLAAGDCHEPCTASDLERAEQSGLNARVGIELFAGAKGYPEMIAGDTRKVRSKNSPKWLEAVGKLTSIVSIGKEESCSIALITDRLEKDGIIAVTASHCVDHWYNGQESYKAGENQVRFTSNSGKVINTSISEVLRAEMNPGDYAVVKLESKISNSDIKPLINAPYDYGDMMDDEYFEGSYATMAGYSADTGLGQKGEVLTYDECVSLNGGASGLKKANCHSYPGASGGAVVVTVDLKDMPEWDYQQDRGEQPYFVGSIKGGRNGDDNSKALFTETTHYSRLLDKILEAN